VGRSDSVDAIAIHRGRQLIVYQTATVPPSESLAECVHVIMKRPDPNFGHHLFRVTVCHV
jgi:hypothetical protein